MVGQKGILQVFVSSPFKNLTNMNGNLISQLSSALENSAIRYFISTGESQKSALEELRTSEIAIFLVLPHETAITECEFTKECEADCTMKEGKGRVPYNWCELKYALSENIPHLIYVVDERWDIIRKDSLLQKMRNECEKNHYPKIQNNDEGFERVINDLANKIINWYANGKINLNRFCGRRELLKELFNKMHKSVEVGVGGIGKTTLCEVVLFIYRVLGKKVIYTGERSQQLSTNKMEYPAKEVIK